MRKIKSHITLFLLLVITTCSQPIELDIDQVGGQLIIFGRISNSTEGNYVSVHRTGPMGSAPVPVSGARVSIRGTDGLEELLVQGDSGMYYFDRSGVRGSFGSQYSLEVILNNQEYTTAPQTILPMYGRDSIFWELTREESISSEGQVVEEGVVEVFASTSFDELPEEFYLRWDIEEAYTYLGVFLPINHFPPGIPQPQCFVVNQLNDQQLFLHNGNTNRTNFIPKQSFVTRRIDKSFQAKHYFNLIKASMSRQTYTYWSEVDKVVNRQGSIFDTPPAGVDGNIRSGTGEKVLGYFEVVSIDTTRAFLTRNDVPIFLHDECFKGGSDWLELFTVPFQCVQCLIDEGIVEPQCLNCFVLPGSSDRRPSYF